MQALLPQRSMPVTVRPAHPPHWQAAIRFTLPRLTMSTAVFTVLHRLMAAASAVNTEGGRQESVAAAHTSNLNNYINNRSTEQIAIVNAARNEHANRGGTETRGGDSYIEALTPDQVSRPESSGSSESMNINWSSHFVGQIMTNAGIDTALWSSNVSTFATNLHSEERFSLPDNYIPRVGDIIFWGRPQRSLTAGQAIRASYCGIFTQVEMVTNHTEINAMRITVIEGDVEGGRRNGNYDHSTVYVDSYTYDLYNTQGNNHHGGTYDQIIGYGTIASDIEAVESTAYTSDYENLVYTINLTSTFDAAIAQQRRTML